jgi:hypothetical protein
MSFRLDEDLTVKVRHLAAQEGRSISNYVNRVIRLHLEALECAKKRGGHEHAQAQIYPIHRGRTSS